MVPRATLRADFRAHAGRLPARRLPYWLTRLVALMDRELRGIAFEPGMRSPRDSSKTRPLLGWAPRGKAAAVHAAGQSLNDQGPVKPL